MKKPAVRKLRCAIYTRKSTEEGLDMEFNSLDAQREACSSYIASQRAEGWVELADQYDDGGFSGGTLERPALKRLLADIEAGRVDVVVVYKIDRLSRSLMDFARLVEVFDRTGVTFVSVTQSFNTTTSMGRLTLNVLLSFAQFERERNKGRGSHEISCIGCRRIGRVFRRPAAQGRGRCHFSRPTGSGSPASARWSDGESPGR
jgi:site-specific DNA recombinase